MQLDRSASATDTEMQCFSVWSKNGLADCTSLKQALAFLSKGLALESSTA